MALVDKTDWAGFEMALAAWLTAATGLTGKIRQKDQEAGSPAKPYMTFKMKAGGREGLDAELRVYNGTTTRYDVVTSGPRRLVVEIAAYTEPPTSGIIDAREYVMRALNSLQSPSIKTLFANAGLSFMKSLSDAMDVSEQLGDRWERRVQADLEFGYTAAFIDTSTADTGITPISTADRTIVIEA